MRLLKNSLTVLTMTWVLVLGGALLTTTPGCDRGAEEAGENIDNAADNAADKAGDAVENAGDRMEDATDKAN